MLRTLTLWALTLWLALELLRTLALWALGLRTALLLALYLLALTLRSLVLELTRRRHSGTRCGT